MTDVCEDFHRWYYESELWDRTSFLGVQCLRSVLDLWNYQEIIVSRKPSVVFETGVYKGGSALFFSVILSQIDPDAVYIGVEKDLWKIDERVRNRSNVLFIDEISPTKACEDRLREKISAFDGGIFAILDSKHDVDTVYGELEMCARLLRAGDTLIVEDSNINGHPVLPDHGPGPMEAIRKFETVYPDCFLHDRKRETKFGFTFSPNGYLRKT